MKTIAITAQKGGAGKSTITAHMAVEFIRKGLTVAILDMDRQGSLKFWRQQREAELPEVLGVSFGEFETYREHCVSEGFDYLLVDTPPHAGVGIQAVTSKADLIVVPVRPGPFDIAALDGTMDIVSVSKTLFVLNQVPATGTEADDTQDLLLDSYPGCTVAKTRLGLRKAYSQALISGHSVVELERPSSKAFQETTSLAEELMEYLK